MEKLVLRVDGMSCNHCKKSIEQSLKGVGAEGSADLDTKTVTVLFDPAATSAKMIIAAIEEQGYDVVS